jgi:hypothetical protein
MTPKQIQLQEAIVLACHPWLSIVECLKIESQFGCLVIDKWIVDSCWWVIKNDIWHKFMYKLNHFTRWDMYPSRLYWEPIWLPPTLPRVLTALEQVYKEGNWLRIEYSSWTIWCNEYCEYGTYQCNKRVFDRKLLKDSWEDATLFDQSQLTQDILFDIICP